MLPDLLRPGLDVVFCGTAVGETSAERGHYYADPRNKFWPTLHEVGLTPRLLEPAEYPLLLKYGIGLIDLVKDRSGMDSVLNNANLVYGRQAVRDAMLEFQPDYLCFNGKRAAKEFFDRTRVSYGLHEERIGNTSIFVAPSTSGAAGRWWNVSVWLQLADLLQANRDGRAAT